MPVNQHNIRKAPAPLKCFQINLRHSRSAALNLAQLIIDLDIDVVLIQEPFAKVSSLSSSIEVKFIPPGYASFHCLSSDHAFGSAIIIRASLKASLCSFGLSNNCCGIKLPNKVFFFSIYCRPSLPCIPSHLASILVDIPSWVKKVATLGIDCNAKNKSWNSGRTNKIGAELEFCFLDHALSISNVDIAQLPHKPLNTSFVDVTLEGDSISLSGWHYPFYPSLSDHPFIMFFVEYDRFFQTSVAKADRLPSPQHCDIPLFLTSLESSLADIPCPDRIQSLNSTKEIDNVIDSLNSVIKSSALKSKLAFHPSRAPAKMPWWSAKLWVLRSKLKALYKLKCHEPSLCNITAYTQQKAAYQRSLRAEKKESWKSFCNRNLNGDIFGEIKTLTNSSPPITFPNELLIDGISISDHSEILSAFSSHFFPVNPPDSPSHKIISDSVKNYCDVPLASSDSYVTFPDLKLAFESLRLTKSPGPDGISAVWLSHAFELIKSHLVALFSACFTLSYFPTKWKSDSIIILKKNNKANYSHPSCFRPISILNALSKLLEKIILVKLKRLASANNWFSPNQHGFRSGFSTETATLSLTSLIERNKKNKVITCCAFLDIKSAFDAAWHPAILNCLISKNCPAFLVKLLANFLNSRSCILSSPLASNTTDTELGCPQGSVLSPFLWNILLEDLLCHNFPFPFRFFAYADDIVVCTMHKDFNLAHAHLQTICDAVVAWGLSVKLTFNGAKSFFLIFSSNRNLPPLTLTVDNITVPRSSSCVYLGLTIDDKLSWNLHISIKCNAVKKMLFLILKCCRLSWGLSRSSISLLYNSSVIPIILYNCSVWASAIRKKRVIASLKASQRPFALVLGRLFKSTSTDAALVLANIVPLHLKVLEVVTKRLISSHAALLPPSSRLIAGDIPDKILSSCNPAEISLRLHRDRLLKSEIYILWNQIWSSATTGAQTRLFFPSVEAAAILDSPLTPFFLCSFLSGHCVLNNFLFKIKRKPSPLCSCLSGDEEDITHIIFVCSNYVSHREKLSACASNLNLLWPVPLHAFAQHKPLWLALSNFLSSTKRFKPRY